MSLEVDCTVLEWTILNQTKKDYAAVILFSLTVV